jgi:hypothetical protein
VAFLVVAASTSVRATPALAEPPPVRVRVEAPLSECIAARELERRVASFFRAGESDTVELAVTFRRRTPAGYRADVTYRSPSGSRTRAIESEHPDCHDLDEPLVVVIDALASEIGAPAEGEPLPQGAPALPARRDASLPPVATSSPSIPPVPHVLALGLGVEFGASPNAVPSVRIDGRISLGGRWAARLGVGTTPRASTEHYSTATVDFRLTSARLLGCFDWFPSIRGHLDTCVGIDGGLVTATRTGFELDETTTRAALWAVAEARAGLTFGVIVPEVFVVVGPSLTRDSYRLTAAGGEPVTLYRTSPFRGAVGLGVGAALP